MMQIHKLSWRKQPEISLERQQTLTAYIQTEADVIQGIYPFKDVVLERADLEWLLATHESRNISGPVYYNDERQANRHGLNIAGANLSGKDLSQLPLAKIIGSFSPKGVIDTYQGGIAINLESSNLTETHLEGAQLAQAHLKRATLFRAYLEKADLTKAQLERTNLEEAHLEEANFAEGSCIGTNLRYVYAEEASFRGSYLEASNLSNAHLEGSDFRSAHAKKTSFNQAHLEGADFSGTHIDGNVDFRGAYLEGATFSQARLEGANFTGAHLEGAIFKDAILEEVDFTSAYLGGVDFTAAQLQKTNFRGAHLEGKQIPTMDLERIRLWVPGFQEHLLPADLREAFLSSATRLKDAILGTKEMGFISVADISWGDINLNVIDWDSISVLGDDQRARKSTHNADKLKYLENYRAAVRANRQLAVILQNQGLNEVAARFSYNSQVLQRSVLWRQRRYGQYFFSLLLDLLAGYGYKPLRSFAVYILVDAIFMLIYHTLMPELSWFEAFIVSVTSFGRGLTPGSYAFSDTVSFLSLFQAYTGLIIEAVFIAALTQRFFGK